MVHKGKKFYLKKEHTQDDSKDDVHLKVSKKAKIIVRNLPFKNLSEKSVEDIFKEYGNIIEVKLLRKDDGKFVGCGFVQFEKVLSAAKAIRYANQKEIHGRKIIVDWALPKNVFIEKAQKLQEEEFNLDKVKTEYPSDNEDSKIEFYIDKKPDFWARGDDDVKVKKESQDEDDSDDDVKVKKESQDEDDSDDDDDDDDDDENDSEQDDADSDNDDDDDDDTEFRNGSKIKIEKDLQEKSRNDRPSDVGEGKTVFIRNVPFSATNDDLKQCVESYGPVEYALICIDKLTEHSKGTAFVKFKEKESATKCIKDSNKVFLHENPLLVTIAVSKTNLEDKKNTKKIKKDSRNLYLVREGVVIPNSKAAEGVSSSDMNKRLQLEQWKTQILKNLNMFVSKTRLVIHNLPPSYDNTKLRQLFLKHGNPKAIIKESKVMREKKNVDSQGNGKSKEVGFVSFGSHEDALKALRSINNNPNIFTPKKRPIVAFSIENKVALNRKQRRLEKSRANLGISNDDKSDKLSKLNRKQRRFIRRKQKIIEKRREAKRLKLGQSSTSETNSETGSANKRKRKDAE